MGNKKIIITKETFKYAKDWGGYFAVYDQSDLDDRPEEFMKVELVPVDEEEGAITAKSFIVTPGYLDEPTVMSIHGKGVSNGKSLWRNANLALKRPNCFEPMWFKILESIKDVRLTKPVEVTLNAGYKCSAIKVIFVENTPFIENGFDFNAFILPEKLRNNFEILSKEAILEIFVAELNSFLQRAKGIIGIADEDGNRSPVITYLSTYFPEADIEVVE